MNKLSNDTEPQKISYADQHFYVLSLDVNIQSTTERSGARRGTNSHTVI